MTTLGMERFPGRCAQGFDHAKQPGLCACSGLAAKATGQAQASAAHPDERAAVDAAIRRLAATGEPFSSNDARSLHGVRGPVVGASGRDVVGGGGVSVDKDAMTDAEWREHFTLPDQRFRVEVRFGGISAWHVMEYRTEPAARHSGRWTRRAASRSTFCGGMRALVIGLDATDWATERLAPDLTRVTCSRCLTRARRLFGASA